MVKRTHVESLLLLPRGYDLRYCLFTCLLLLRDRNGVGLPPPPNPQAGTTPGDPHCGRKGYAWAAPGFCLSAKKVVTTTPRTPAGSVAPRSPGPRMGRAGTGSARRGRGEPPRINAGTRHAPPPHSGGYTRAPPVLLGRGGIGTPRGGLGAHEEFPSPHNGGYTRVPPVLPGPRRERGAPWGFGGTRRTLPHTAAVTPESLRSCLGRGGIGTPRGGLRTHVEFPPPHSGGYTRVPPVLLGR